jgi:hypothetical protein
MEVSIIAHCSLTAQKYLTVLSGAGSNGECATFEVWVEANGPEFIELDEILDRFVKPRTFCNSKYGHTKRHFREETLEQRLDITYNRQQTMYQVFLS